MMMRRQPPLNGSMPLEVLKRKNKKTLQLSVTPLEIHSRIPLAQPSTSLSSSPPLLLLFSVVTSRRRMSASSSPFTARLIINEEYVLIHFLQNTIKLMHISKKTD